MRKNIKKQIKYYVWLHPNAVPLFEAISETIVSKNGLINCYSVSYEMHFLEVNALYHSPPDPEYCVHLSIPYQYVSYIVSSPDVDLKKILGFHGSLKKSEPHKD